ncbi:MAG TPA: regulatory protein RecX [Burkholderiaceae bacterium]
MALRTNPPPGDTAVEAPTSPPPDALLRRAIALLARRDYRRTEIQRKLRRGLLPTENPQRIGEVLERLEALGLMSDAKLAVEFVRARAARFGPTRLRHDLELRGIDKDVIAQALREAGGAELEAARALWRNRFGTVAEDRRERARQARFLAARGFSLAVISRVVSGLDDE